MSAIEKELKEFTEYILSAGCTCDAEVGYQCERCVSEEVLGKVSAELARLQAIAEAASIMFKALNGTLSVLRMWREFAPRNWDQTDVQAVDFANMALAAYEKAVKGGEQ